MTDTITTYIRAGFAGLYLITHEDVRAEADLKAVAETLGYSLMHWTVTRGMLDTQSGEVTPLIDPVEAIDALTTLPEQTILVLNDFHAFLGSTGQPASPVLLRTLKDTIRAARQQAKVVVVVAPSQVLPIEVEKDFTIIDYALPDADALTTVAGNILASAELTMDDTGLHAVAEAASGLTIQEAEDIMALSVVATGSLDSTRIGQEKAKAIGKSGLLDILEPTATADDIGGLDNLKHWLAKRRRAFTPEAKVYGLPMPKGVLILGIPGTGKSLTAKAAAHILGRPILKLDAGKLFAGIVGESEANLRRTIQVAESIAPCILWIDEIEKGFSGSGNQSADGGTSARVFGSFLNWMQEKEAPVFVVATANDVQQLPPEFLRKGRFDDIFFVDLPDAREREAIWHIHLEAVHRDPADFDCNALAVAAESFTGAEIEQVIIDALYEAFDADADLNQAALLEAIDHTVPLATTMAERINALRTWAQGRARPASHATRLHHTSA